MKSWKALFQKSICSRRTTQKNLSKFLEKAYEKEFKDSSDLNTKATSMITMSGTIATLFMGFGSIVLKDIPKSNYLILISASLILLLEVILTTFTIKKAVDAYKVKVERKYFYAMNYEQFFDFGREEFDMIEVEKFVKQPKTYFNVNLIQDYLNSILHNVKLNESKRDIINDSQCLFSFALLMVPIFALVIVVYKLVS